MQKFSVRTMRKTVLSLYLVVCGLFLLSVTGLASASAPITPKDDAYHYVADQLHNENYIEWWYFNFYDENKDVQFAVSYFVADPENLSYMGTARLVVFAYLPGQEPIVETMYFFDPANQFSADTEICDVSIGDVNSPVGHAWAEDENNYRVQGSVISINNIQWDLTYERQLGGYWYPGFAERVGLNKWEWLEWMLYMTGAEVTGQITVNGKSYDVEAVRGYHDHNWGQWLFFGTMWDWAQVSKPEDGFSLAWIPTLVF
jgi:hypothetical protein